MADSDYEITLELPRRVQELHATPGKNGAVSNNQDGGHGCDAPEDAARSDYEKTLKLPARVHESYIPHEKNGALLNGHGDGHGSDGPADSVARPRVHLAFLDSLRGLAALYVALGHSYVSMRPHLNYHEMSHTLVWFLKLTDMGHFAVALFIVLSGFCLMMPVARSADGKQKGGTIHFLRGRVRRIVPPYLAALGISLVLMWLVEWIQSDGAIPGSRPPSELSAGSILSHVFLVHNLFPAWCQSINGPMWSVALESQIYLFFPLLLLPLWRRRGIGAAIAASMVIGLAPGMVLPHAVDLSWTYPWYICLFTFGMAAASICYSQKPGMIALRTRVPWGAIAGVLCVVCTAVLVTSLSWCWRHLWLTDLVLGFAAASFITYCALACSWPAGDRQPAILRALSFKPLVVLGGFSYSLYLIHMPVMLLTADLFGYASISPIMALALQMFIILPVVVVAAYGFHVVAERPFMGGGKTAAAVPAAGRNVRVVPKDTAVESRA